MKVQKRQLRHWVLLLLFFFQCFVGLLRRLRSSVGSRKKIILYGHKLNGNLGALYDYLIKNPDLGFDPFFLSMDRKYCNELEKKSMACVWASGGSCSKLLGCASAVISDHGLHSLQPWRGVFQYFGMRFIDVWHGIPFKGFDADDFRVQRKYDEVWVASDSQRKLWVEKFDFDSEAVWPVGYARTDQLVGECCDSAAYRNELGLPMGGRIVLFAPTWAQDSDERSLFPFGVPEDVFLQELSELAERHAATIVIRSHLNCDGVTTEGYAKIVSLPASEYPDTEEILLVSDVLICDWSSIAFDYLLLQRPTFFLDVPAPFNKGFSLGPEYRFGEIVSDFSHLIKSLDSCLSSPEQYWASHREKHNEVKNEVYGGRADGNSASRALSRLSLLTDS